VGIEKRASEQLPTTQLPAGQLPTRTTANHDNYQSENSLCELFVNGFNNQYTLLPCIHYR